MSQTQAADTTEVILTQAKKHGLITCFGHIDRTQFTTCLIDGRLDKTS